MPLPLLHHGEIQAPLIGSLIVSPLWLHSYFVTAHHIRGNPPVRDEVIIDGRAELIFKNLEVFLKHVRCHDVPLALWIREICLNHHDDDKKYARYNPTFQTQVEFSSCGVTDMSRVIQRLYIAEILQPQHHPAPKLWNIILVHLGFPSYQPLSLRIRPRPSCGARLAQEQVEQPPEYMYVPLDLMAEEIRVLSVYPARDGYFDDPILVDLRHSPLHDIFDYMALSCTWGSEKRTKTIQAGKDSLKVTVNLEAALHHLRAAATTNQIILWVDAICINQNNVHEKNLHVLRMQTIYERAKRSLHMAWPTCSTRDIRLY